MALTKYNDLFQQLRDYLFYLETIKGRSPKTVQEYYTDLRTFFRFILVFRSDDHTPLSDNTAFQKISIANVTLDLIRSITLSDIYEFLHFMDEKMYSVEPVMVSTPSYEFQPMADVEKEFLSLFEELKEKIREEESKK